MEYTCRSRGILDGAYMLFGGGMDEWNAYYPSSSQICQKERWAMGRTRMDISELWTEG